MIFFFDTFLAKSYMLNVRVYDDWPLYDVLKLFQKGHSHMAVVVKSQRDGKETEEQTKESPKFMRMQIDSNSEPAATDVKGTK